MYGNREYKVTGRSEALRFLPSNQGAVQTFLLVPALILLQTLGPPVVRESSAMHPAVNMILLVFLCLVCSNSLRPSWIEEASSPVGNKVV